MRFIFCFSLEGLKKKIKKNGSVFGLGKRDKRVVGIRALIDLLYVEKK